MPRPRVFYTRDFGHFWSFKDDLSDLGGPFLEAAQNRRASDMPVPGFDVPNNYYEPDNEEPEMSKTIELNIPASAEVRARRSVILSLLEEMLSHDLTKEQTVIAIDDLIGAAVAQATGRTRAGNDISGI